MTRSTIGLLAVLLAAGGAALSAGGWAVTTIQHLPDYAVAGTPLRLSFAVRQHGVTLAAGLTGEVVATDGAGAVRGIVAATGKPGYYTADITLPAPGRWTITITSWGQAEVSMPVVAAGQPAPVLSLEDRGARLFDAKGCATCHGARGTGGAVVGGAPALTTAAYTPAFLAGWLQSPRPCASGRPCMPNLGLAAEEISALSAFISRDARSTGVARR